MSWFSRFNPAPAFPSYTGPYQVGTVDVETPAAGLSESSQSQTEKPETVAFRIFYPCEKQETADRPVRWIPGPQKATLSAFAKFLGANSRFAEIFAAFPHLLYYIKIPAQRNAPLLPAPTKNKRWPLLFFSHGLAGSRNMYSHICGSMASHGLVVIAMDHRDGSSPIQYIRATDTTPARIVEPVTLSHQASPEVFEGRDDQLRIRLWELCQAFTALLEVDKGRKLQNLDLNTSNSAKERKDYLSMFANSLDIHEPGKVAWSGHSFGACTTVQLLKSVFYANQIPADARKALFQPTEDCPLRKQITSSSPIALLDLWGLPFNSPDQAWLLERPLPCYEKDGAGGKAITAIVSEAFYKWSGNLEDVKRAISPPAAYKGIGPSFSYVTHSQHFSQSDFGILFPWITRRLAKAEEPERILKLNMRASLQMLRDCGFEVANTSAADMEAAEDDEKIEVSVDSKILATDGSVRGWITIPLDASDGRNNATRKERMAPSDNLQNGRMEL